MSDPAPHLDHNNSTSQAVDFAKVRDDEFEAIKRRREVAHMATPDSSPENDLVGVALSGGGLRSAMFNLGFLQALQEAGFMKYVDYLSTVSGGGYVGGFYSTLGHHFVEKQPPHPHASSTSTKGSALDIQVDTPNEKAGATVAKDAGPESAACDQDHSRHFLPELTGATHRFINAGQYLNQPWIFLGTCLVPSLKVFALFFTGLVMLSSLIAMFLRLFDEPQVNEHLEMMSLNSELGALCAAVGSLWLIFMAIYRGFQFFTRDRHRPADIPKAAKYGAWLKLSVLAFLCGVAIVIGNYDFDLTSGQNIQLPKVGQIPLFVLAGLGTLSLFKLPQLLQSEQAKASFWQKATLWLVLSATVGGGSLAVLSFIGSEGISGYARLRGPQLDPEDVVENFAFVSWINGWFKEQVPNHFDDMADTVRKCDVKPVDSAKTNAKHADGSKTGTKLPDNDQTGKSIDENLMQLDLIRREVFPDDISWRGSASTFFHMDDVARVFRYFGRFFEQNHPITALLDKQEVLRSKRNAWIDEINPYLFPNITDPLSTKPSTEDLKNGPIDGNPTRQLLAAFSNRVTNHNKASPQPAVTVPPGKPANEGNRASDSQQKDAGSGATESNDASKVRAKIVAYLNSTTNHANLPLLEKAQLLKDLAPMIQPDGGLKYENHSLMPAKELNFRRQLLEATFPDVFKQRSFVSTPVVVRKDQWARLWIFLVSSVLFSFLCFHIDFNRDAAIFRFYRERIAKTFIEAGSPNQHDADIRLSRFSPWEKGFPYPLISAALKLPESIDLNQYRPHEVGHNPKKVDGSVGSDWYSFLLSPMYVGYQHVNSGETLKSGHNRFRKTYRSTDKYLEGHLKVSDAVTLSGAAFTPWMANNTALNLLMHFFNIRLEQWLPNPESSVCLQSKQPMKLWQLLREGIRCTTREGLKNWQWGIVADGGFREFLGVEELILRRCRIIVVSDAGCNNGISEFGVLADLVRQLRLDHDVRIIDLDHDLPLDTDRMQRTHEGRGIQHFIIGRIRYPETEKKESLYERTGLFVYVQMSITGDEDVDLAQFQRVHPEFPDEPIANQFFSGDQVESLRQLGNHVGRHLCQRFSLSDFSPELDPTQHRNELPGEESSEAVQKPPKKSSAVRLERLSDALVGAYLVECRQEEYVSKDDTPPDMPIYYDTPDSAAVEAFREYEERGTPGRRLSHFVTCVIDGYSVADLPADDNPSKTKDELTRSITEIDLTGLAVECNRRHVGFRSENPSRYFRIGGRRLLLRSTTRAIGVCKKWLTDDQDIEDERVIARRDQRNLVLIHAVARLAAIVPDGIFRAHGIETARDLTLCVLTWLRARLDSDLASDGTNFGAQIDRWINRAVFRRGLQSAILTGLATEIGEFLADVLVRGKDPLDSRINQLPLGQAEPTSFVLLSPARETLPTARSGQTKSKR